MKLHLLLLVSATSSMLGCAVESSIDSIDRESGGPLAAEPRTVELGTIAVGREMRVDVVLTNRGESELQLASVDLESFSPDCPLFDAIRSCRASLIAPCVRPGDSTTMTLTCSPDVAGEMNFGIGVRYSDGRTAFELDVPTHGIAR